MLTDIRLVSWVVYTFVFIAILAFGVNTPRESVLAVVNYIVGSAITLLAMRQR